MPNEVFAPLTGALPGIRDRSELEAFLEDPAAGRIVASSSFEQVFFTIRAVGLNEAAGLLPHVTPEQVRGFVDLDCWRKDTFVRRPFMEWIAAFVEAGPEDTVQALSGIDEDVVALFLKDLVDVYEIERDEPPPVAELVITPDGRLGVGQRESGPAASIAALILDALFRYAPDLGVRVLRRVRYTTRTELEEIAYQNKMRRLDVHGFVDYYEALSIYAPPTGVETFARPSSGADADTVPGDVTRQTLPTIFAESLGGGGLLMAALADIDEADASRLADELTALGNRVISANLVSLGEVDGIRVALGEMKDYLTIGLESLARGEAPAAAAVLRANHAQAVFRTGFAEIARLRTSAERLIALEGFRPELLESPDVEFVTGLLRFKPLLWSEGAFRGFGSLAEVEDAFRRVDDLLELVEGLLGVLGPVDSTLRRAFNTALVRQALTGRFESEPLSTSELESFLEDGIAIPEPDLPEPLRSRTRGWLPMLRADLEPLAGGRIDPRFVDCVRMKL